MGVGVALGVTVTDGVGLAEVDGVAVTDAEAELEALPEALAELDALADALAEPDALADALTELDALADALSLARGSITGRSTACTLPAGKATMIAVRGAAIADPIRAWRRPRIDCRIGP